MRTFFKDIRGNYWATKKIVGIVEQQNPENETEKQYIIVLDGGMSTEVTLSMYDWILSTIVTIDIEDKEDE